MYKDDKNYRHASKAFNYHLELATKRYVEANSIAREKLEAKNEYFVRAPDRWAQFAADQLGRPDLAYCISNRVVSSALYERSDIDDLRAKSNRWFKQNLEFQPYFLMSDEVDPTRQTPVKHRIAFLMMDDFKHRIAFSLKNGNLYPMHDALEETPTDLIGANDLAFLNSVNKIRVHIHVRINLPSPVVHSLSSVAQLKDHLNVHREVSQLKLCNRERLRSGKLDPNQEHYCRTARPSGCRFDQ